MRWALTRSLLALTLAAATVTGARAGDASSVEYPVKAAFIYNFMRYVEWPASDGGEMVVGVLGKDAFGDSIVQALAGKAVAGRNVTLKRFPTAQDVGACDVLIVPASTMREWPLLRQQLQGRPVLTVGETRGFTSQGGIIGFVVEANRLQFDVNAGAAEAAQLRLSSRLLSLAHSVRRAGK